jgi:hypothetical protein
MVNDAYIGSLKLQTKLRKEVAWDYGISARTLNRWFRKTRLNIPNGLIDPYHLKIIYDTFGFPKKVTNA